MNQLSKTDQFLNLLKESIEKKTLIKLIISNKQDKQSDLNTINCKLVQLKKGLHLSFVYRHETRDITKNFVPDIALRKITEYLEVKFRQVYLLTQDQEIDLNISHKGRSRLSLKKSKRKISSDLSHDKAKTSLLSNDKSYLKELGILSTEGKILKGRNAKYRQINKFVEILKPLVDKESFSKEAYSLVDMGAGKGYLTFALYDFLTSQLKHQVRAHGIEFRQELVDMCNDIADNAGFHELKFIQGTIEHSVFEKPDVLIALHACDTATDDAIYRGISNKARLIVCSPCCHKQIRKQISSDNLLMEITQFGILKERQAEMVTDVIRSLILEAYGYRTRIMEFISTDHTPKNLLISGELITQRDTPDPQVLHRISKLKAVYGIEFHHLEKLLAI